MTDRMANLPPLHVAVISARRPDAVAAMAPFLARVPSEPTWYVDAASEAAYRSAGAASIVVAGDGSLVASRNAALDAAFAAGVPCVQLSDDLRSLRAIAARGGPPYAFDLDLAIRALLDGLHESGAYLAGAAPTANPFYASPTLALRHFIVGDFMVVRPSPLRMDPRAELREDYDFTLQHLSRFGSVARLDWVLAEFAHRGNAGGAVSTRAEDPGRNAAVNAYLLAKWPGCLRPNPRRPGEVLLSWPPKA